jgi:hypothetical protein
MFAFVSNDTNNFEEKVYFDVSQPMLGVRFCKNKFFKKS